MARGRSCRLFRRTRLFLFTHYPLYVSDAAEPESYDNIDEPGRGWLLGLIRRYQPEAVFAAHVHNFWYDRIDATEYYVVPSTCFVRHDYSEMYRIDGGDQKGRNDGAKLGTHYPRHLREWSRRPLPSQLRRHAGQGRGGAGGAAPTRQDQQPHSHLRRHGHAWAEEMVVAPSGALDEFRRKQSPQLTIPLMALWEMGLRGLRVPIQDLQDARTRGRMEIMTDVGHLLSRLPIYCLPKQSRERFDRWPEHRRARRTARTGCELGMRSKEASNACGLFAAATQLPIILSRVNQEGSRQACRRPVQSSDQPWLQS